MVLVDLGLERRVPLPFRVVVSVLLAGELRSMWPLCILKHELVAVAQGTRVRRKLSWDQGELLMGSPVNI